MTYQVVHDPDVVRQVLARPNDFVPSNALTAVVPIEAAALRILSRVGFALPPVLASATGELHARTRQAVAKFFTPNKIAAVAPRVTELTRQRAQLVNTSVQVGPVDLATEIAMHIPATIMREMIGIDYPDLVLLRRWSRDSLELFWGWPDPLRQRELADSAAEFYSWLRGEVISRRGHDCLFGTLHAAGLTTKQICSLGYFLVIAAQETTSQLISIGLYRALKDRHRWDELSAGAPAQPFVRRLLATESSVPTWRRVAARDTELDGSPVPAGAEILLELTGHHSPSARPTAYALAFGHGLHRCLGARLAELETALVLETTATILPDITLTGLEPDWIRLLSFQTPRNVTVKRAGR